MEPIKCHIYKFKVLVEAIHTYFGTIVSKLEPVLKVTGYCIPTFFFLPQRIK